MHYKNVTNSMFYKYKAPIFSHFLLYFACSETEIAAENFYILFLNLSHIVFTHIRKILQSFELIKVPAPLPT